MFSEKMSLELVEIVPSGQKHFLDNVIYQICPRYQPVLNVGIDTVGVKLHKLCSRFPVFLENRRDELQVTRTRVFLRVLHRSMT